MSLPNSGRAFVKSVISGDSIILRGRPVGGPPPEKILSLANVIAPRLGTPSDPSKEEAGAFEAREYLRKLLVGKEVAYKVEYTTSSNSRDFGAISLQPPGVDSETNVARLLVKTGLVKVKAPEGKRASTDEQTALLELEAAAQVAKLGMWADSPVRSFTYAAPEDPRAFLNKFKGTQVDAIVDQVRDGSTMRVCLIINEGGKKSYQYVTLSLTGIKAPVYRVGVNNVEDLVEPFSEEAKYFVESRLLQRDVKVLLEGVNPNGTFVGTVLHPAGNIAEALLAEGYATVVSWNVALVTGGPAKLRAAEQKAKDKKIRLWKNFVAKAKGGPETEFDGLVVKINGADSISVVPASNPDGAERKITFSSLRAPKPKDEKEAYYNHEAKEFLRQRLIGKTVRVSIDFVKPAEGQFEERECATVTFNGTNMAEALISKGLGLAVRHKKDDDNRASAYDALLLAEDRAQKATKGVHSTKEPPTLRIADASETAAKAKQFLPFLQRSGYISGVVDFVAAGSRFKVWIPSQNTKITLVLAGIRTPKAGRLNEKAEQFGPESLEFANRKILQRDVEIFVEGADKVGGFIGNLFIQTPNGRVNFASMILEAGLATIHDYSASQSQFAKDLYSSEKTAQDKRIGIWSVRAPDAEAAAKESADALANADDGKPAEVKEAYVSDIGDEGKLSLQFVGPDLSKLEKLLSDFAAFHALPTSQPIAPTHPKVNDYVSAKFSADETWYRAKVKSINEDKTYTVVFIDYGNVETVTSARLRPLDARFSVVYLPAFAKEARLAYVTVPALTADYGDVAFERLRDETEGRKLIAKIITKTNDGVHHVVLQSGKDTVSINEALVSEGISTVDRSITRRFENDTTLAAASKGSRKAYIASLLKAQNEAKTSRQGLWRYGDFMGEDEL
ncbi:hypothetical protein HDU97_001845 [Phlyctochytrium planicorne]|nr:hypothetical protein HDU97_001845 [Phlyctochytrium planicorne]